MATTNDVPKFGLLSGIKVLSTGSAYAGPYAATVMAENGATVIQAESSIVPDTARMVKYAWAQEHRNELAIAFNIPTPEGKEIFLKLIKWADIWIESSKGGTYAKWNLTDELLWQHNPKLTIVHVSGFGQEGDPDYVKRASYDAVGQAFGGYMFINGMPEPNPPMRANPYTCDYITALNAAWVALASYIKAQQTGQGESIDLAQFETMARIQSQYPMTYLNDNVLLKRNGNADPMVAGYSVYQCKDGNYVFIGLAGGGPMKRGLPLLGLDKDPDFPPGFQLAMQGTPAGIKLEQGLQKFCDEHDAMEVDRIFNDYELPCSIVMNVALAKNHPHYLARNVYTEWEDPQYGKVTGVNVLPRTKKYPGKIWRGSPLYGQDNSDLLKELGYSQEQIEELYQKGIVKAGKGIH